MNFLKKICSAAAIFSASIAVSFASPSSYQPTASIAALQAYGNASASVAHAIVNGRTFDYTSTVIAPDGCVNFAPALPGTGTWVGSVKSSRSISLSECTTLANADAYATANGFTLVIDQYTTLTAATTLNAPVVRFQGGRIIRGTNAITINVIDAPDVQIFDTSTSTSGHLTLTKQIPYMWPEWFGAVGDAVADDSYALIDFAYTIGHAGAPNGSGGTAAMHRTYKISQQFPLYYVGIQGKAFYLDASGATVCYNGTGFPVKVQSPSNRDGITVYGLGVDEVSSCASGLSAGGFDLINAQHSRCVACTVSGIPAKASATWAGFQIEDDGVNGSYWAVLEDTLVQNTGAGYLQTAYRLVNNENAVKLIRPKCVSVTDCVVLEVTNATLGTANAVLIDGLAAQGLQTSMIHVKNTASTNFIGGLRVVNSRLEPGGSVTLFLFDGSQVAPDYGGDPISLYDDNNWSVLPTTGVVTRYNMPSGMMYVKNGTRHQFTAMGANATASIFSWGNASKEFNLMSGFAGVLGCVAATETTQDRLSVDYMVMNTGQGITNTLQGGFGGTPNSAVINGVNPLPSGITAVADTHYPGGSSVQATAYGTGIVQVDCGFSGTNDSNH